MRKEARSSPGPLEPAADRSVRARRAGEASSADGAPGRLAPETFGTLYQENWRVLWCAACAMVGDRTLAQDLVQQAAVVGLERLGDFEAGTSFTAWMVQIVRNLAMNEVRRTRRRKTGAADPSGLDQRAGDEERAGGDGAGLVGNGGGWDRVREGQTELDDRMMGALESLEEDARACLLMRVVLGMSYRGIGLALDMPEGTAASHVHRARSAMRARLEDRDQGRPGKAGRG